MLRSKYNISYAHSNKTIKKVILSYLDIVYGIVYNENTTINNGQGLSSHLALLALVFG